MMDAKSFVERVRVCEMSAREITGLIPEAALEAIRARDPHPCFVAWEVGRTGFSTGRLGEAGSVKKFWSSEIVQELANAGNARPVIQVNHSGAEAKPRRIGEILRGIARRVGDVVRALWIGYIEDRDAARAIRRNELPTCSIEGMVDVRETEEMGIEVVGVPVMRALALAGAGERAGFEDAGVLAVVQETDSAESEEQTMTDEIFISDVKQFIEQNGVRADELYPAEALAALPLIADLVKNEAASALESLDLARLEQMGGRLADEARKLREERDAALGELAEYKKSEISRRLREKALAHPLLYGVRKDVAAVLVATMDIDAIIGAKNEDEALERELRAVAERAREAGAEIPALEKKNDNKRCLTPLVDGFGVKAEVESVTPDGAAKDYTKPENNVLIPR
jgi:hypothetical protein